MAEKHPEGGWAYRSLRNLLSEVFKSNDPILANITFFMGFRNQIEHRHESEIAALIAGKTQALLINYENSWCRCWAGGGWLSSPCTTSTRGSRTGPRCSAPTRCNGFSRRKAG
jgi:hypothetical protein